jgi:uncharacterized protein with HEPN domain
MRRAAGDAVDFTRNQERTDFYADLKTQRAVVMSLFLIGETAANVMDAYPETIAKNPAVPWKSIRGMRNRIAHNFYALEIDIVWETVRDSVPVFLDVLDDLR